MDAHARPAECIFIAGHPVRRHFGGFALGAGGGAVFQVADQVEDRFACARGLALQGQGLADEPFVAGKMLAYRYHRQRSRIGVKDFIGMQRHLRAACGS